MEIIKFLELGGKNTSYYWIGLTDKQVENRFEWQTSGKEASYTNWREGEPNGFYHEFQREEDCVNLEFGDRTWNDNNCNHSHMDALCQIGEFALYFKTNIIGPFLFAAKPPQLKVHAVGHFV